MKRREGGNILLGSFCSANLSVTLPDSYCECVTDSLSLSLSIARFGTAICCRTALCCACDLLLGFVGFHRQN